MIKNLLILLIAIMVIPFSTAFVDYNQSGNPPDLSNDFSGTYLRGQSKFNSGLDPDLGISTSTQIFSNPQKMPLVSDLDGDGIQEIIILNGQTFVILQNTTLGIVDSYALDSASTERYSNVITFDIDGDGLTEIITVGEEEEELWILEFNNSQLVNDTAFAGIPVSTTHISGQFAGEITIACSAVETCVMAYADRMQSDSSSTILVTVFNSTRVSNENEVNFQVADTGAIFCAPKIRHMAIADYDQDGTDEFIFAYSEPDETDDDEINIFYFNLNSTLFPNLEQTITTTEVGDIFEEGAGADPELTCDDSLSENGFADADGFGEILPNKYFTAPLVFDADFTEAGLETIIGVATDADEYIMIMYRASGSEIREFPLIQETEGQIISNIFLADAFDDSGTVDFCVLGSSESIGANPSNFVSVTCGTKRDSDGFGLFNLNTIEFRSNLTFGLPFNLSDVYDNFQVLTHSSEADSSNDNSEIISAYGTLELDLSGTQCSLTGDCELNLLFQNPIPNSTIVPVDIDNVGFEDWLALSPTNLFYLNDNVINQPVSSFDFITNPCIDAGPVKINTTLSITVTPTDPEGDSVASRITIYANDTNEQIQTSANVTSGTTIPFTFTLNKTIGTSILVIEAFDSVNMQPLSESRGFSVANNGVEFGDCVTSSSTNITVEVSGIIENATISVDATDNSVITGIQNFSDISGLAGTTIWLILMLAFSLFMFFHGATMEWSGNSTVGAIAIINVLFIILGARLGILSTGLVVIIVTLAVVIIGVFLGRFITGLRANAD
tara:strand:- start:709 stop:3063 length:2355 start_codon:yes stop_codon:yes gene_type:complete